MRLSKGLVPLLIACCSILLFVQNAEGCSCVPTHPQTQFCSSNFVVVVKVKKIMIMENELAYKVKIIRKFKLSNNSYNIYLHNGIMYTANTDSMCGVQLDIGETYVVGGRIYKGKPWLTICDFVKRWADVTKRQRKGLKGLYAKGCMCNVSYTSFVRKGVLLHRAKGKLCPWEESPGPMDCQEQHGICVSNQGRCFWMPSRTYDQCIKQHHQTRLLHQRPREWF